MKQNKSEKMKHRHADWTWPRNQTDKIKHKVKQKLKQYEKEKKKGTKTHDNNRNKNPSFGKHPWIIQMQFPFQIRLFVQRQNCFSDTFSMPMYCVVGESFRFNFRNKSVVFST